jgi:hypothetical protein
MAIGWPIRVEPRSSSFKRRMAVRRETSAVIREIRGFLSSSRKKDLCEYHPFVLLVPGPGLAGLGVEC